MWTSRATSTPERYAVPSSASAIRARSAETRSPFARTRRAPARTRTEPRPSSHEAEHLAEIEQHRREIDEEIRRFEQGDALGGESLGFVPLALSRPDLPEDAQREWLHEEAFRFSERSSRSAPARSPWS